MFTPANHGTYGIQEDKGMLTFMVSQLRHYCQPLAIRMCTQVTPIAWTWTGPGPLTVHTLV